MNHIEAPNENIHPEKTVFLGGGITNCPDWQSEMVDLLKDLPVTLLNPRRRNFNIEDESIEEEQINWEFDHLHKADVILFWFPKETLCPITLYELGSHLRRDAPIFVGVHPEYERSSDLEIQIGLIRPEIGIVNNLENLSIQVKDFLINKE